MKTARILKTAINNQQGAVAILLGIALLTLISFAALAVDIGYILTTKSELQNIADATALAAARQLAASYPPPIDANSVRTIAQQVAQSNWAGGINAITIDPSDIEIGIWNGTSFSESLTFPNAIRTTIRRDNDWNGRVTTFFANLLRINSVELQATAIAALSGPVIIPGQAFRWVVDGRGASIFPGNAGFIGTLGSIPSLVE